MAVHLQHFEPFKALCLLQYVHHQVYQSVRRAIQEQRNIEARSCNNCCSGKAINVTQFVSEFGVSRHPVRNAHALNCNLWPVQLYRIFTLYLIKGAVCENTCELIKQHTCLDFLCNFLYETFLNLRRIERDVIGNIYRSTCTATLHVFLTVHHELTIH